MVSEIRIYIEGDRSLRPGFGKFLERLNNLARERRIGWEIVLCGSRDSTFDDFKTALETHPNAFNVLLVDAEGPVTKTPWQHLKDRARWESPGVDDTHCHLMVQSMEAWFVADPNALRAFYKQGFDENSLPKRARVEEVDKATLKDALERAFRATSKPRYHKTSHAPKILGLLSETTVRKRAIHCERLFTTLEGKIRPDPGDAEPTPAAPPGASKPPVTT
jgi:hypothetical protein